MQKFTNGRVTVVIIDGAAHVLAPTSTRFKLTAPNMDVDGTYVCQDGCCDKGLKPDVEAAVVRAAELGATKVVLRTALSGKPYSVTQIAGLPIEDVENHVRDWSEGASTYKVKFSW